MAKLYNGLLVLAGDVGGTKTHLALLRVEASRGRAHFVKEESARFATGEFGSLEAVVREFLGAKPPLLACAGFGVPGPVKNGRAKGTNLAWTVDAGEVGEAFGIPHVAVLNDLAANACGIVELGEEDFVTLQEGAPDAAGNRCVVSPGTGLGEAGLFWDGQRHLVWACEGGHAGFAPRDELQVELLGYLRRKYGHVSAERVVSGLGLPNIYNFLRDTGRGEELPEVRERLAREDAGKVIGEFAREGRCRLCRMAIEVFVDCLGAEAGNMALKAMATGGVFLGGGIPAKILPELQTGRFLEAFNGKEPLRGLMEEMPVRVILNDEAALLGAARYALDTLD